MNKEQKFIIKSLVGAIIFIVFVIANFILIYYKRDIVLNYNFNYVFIGTYLVFLFIGIILNIIFKRW
ncbi:MAG TPA: hypothetical protein VJB89_03730 [Candidatus Nanoarchaeia archaeon]|nr:hypothetical protein [Candidatus Nanoarchaeia archaeon]